MTTRFLQPCPQTTLSFSTLHRKSGSSHQMNDMEARTVINARAKCNFEVSDIHVILCSPIGASCYIVYTLQPTICIIILHSSSDNANLQTVMGTALLTCDQSIRISASWCYQSLPTMCQCLCSLFMSCSRCDVSSWALLVFIYNVEKLGVAWG